VIDIENKVFNDVSVDLISTYSTLYPTLTRYSEYVELPTQFPCVSFYEESNVVNKSMSTLNEIEAFADVSYNCNVYANSGDKKKTCKDIASTISDTMKRLGFVRTFYNQIPNADRTVYRITMRFEGTVEKGITNGTNTIYRVH